MVARYGFDNYEELTEKPDGGWVSWSEYEKLQAALGQISRMRGHTDKAVVLITLGAAIEIAKKALEGGNYIVGCATCGKPFVDGKPACGC